MHPKSTTRHFAGTLGGGPRGKGFSQWGIPRRAAYPVGLLITHYATQVFITEAADELGADPDRYSYVSTIN